MQKSKIENRNGVVNKNRQKGLTSSVFRSWRLEIGEAMKFENWAGHLGVIFVLKMCIYLKKFPLF